MGEDSTEIRSVLELSANEARDYFLTDSSYCSFDLPDYFDFSEVLSRARSIVESGKPFKRGRKAVGKLDNVNYEILVNKDGAYGWRPFQLVHPMLYADLVVTMTTANAWETIQSRFKQFQSDSRILCKSIPLADAGGNSRALSISNWWKEVEQESIRLSLDYRFMATTDIVDCYGALYTHSISWALHTKPFAKEHRGYEHPGNAIDNILQDMHNRQTNGIPQGNVASDLIAEMVLGYADFQLLEEIDTTDGIDFKIIRYRDDYRIFTNSEQDAKHILLTLTKVLSELNFKLNASKTNINSDIIGSAIKDDKLHWNSVVQRHRNLFKNLLLVRALAEQFPNSGSLVKALTAFRQRIEKLSKRPNDNPSLIAVVVDVMYKNPRVYPQATSILSKLLSFEDQNEIGRYLDSIQARFSDIPNTGLLDLWIQRFSWSYDPERTFNEPLCQVVTGGSTDSIWNFDWLTRNSKEAILNAPIVDTARLATAGSIISVAETETFASRYDEATA
ncbi:reverse transcriptase [Corynebacterium deserti GIMN1.010]|uniref:Reverse transcriptase n=1 Tax=Corynebacterium deserti GIMN1.010 TaxID=931089 RepID=A0A0M4CFM7_9CORY|nr:RNA-directed DNA polymerase [Corynebacterium deserti]ALC06966.1 reverse transcriptase [Corynebacterium deserti GIMN1.010]